LQRRKLLRRRRLRKPRRRDRLGVRIRARGRRCCREEERR